MIFVLTDHFVHNSKQYTKYERSKKNY